MHSSLPLGHKLIAVVVAVATACGAYAFLYFREAQMAFSASLSFDSAEAQQLDPSITRTPHPAVVLGQSILSDSVVAGLIPQADLAPSSNAVAIGEFRSRVELSQPAAGLLWVRYRDLDPGQAVATANAVAKALAAWAPSVASATSPAANAQPAPIANPNPAPASAAPPQHAPATEPSPGVTPQNAPAAGLPPATVPQNAPAAEPSLADALGKLQAQLSAADQRVGSESSLPSEHDRQRYLESQVRVAQQKLSALRSEFAHSGSASGEQAHVAAIQHALTLFWPSADGLNTAGTSEAQLRYEREQFTRDISIVEQQRQAAQREEAANSAPVNPPAKQNPPAQQTAPLPPQPQPAPAEAAPSPAASGATSNPLHLERMASLPELVAWWPAALIGCFCGLLYWGLAFARYRPTSEPDDMLDLLDLPEESEPPAYSLINNVPATFSRFPRRAARHESGRNSLPSACLLYLRSGTWFRACPGSVPISRASPELNGERPPRQRAEDRDGSNPRRQA